METKFCCAVVIAIFWASGLLVANPASAEPLCDQYSSDGFKGCLGGNWQTDLTDDMRFIQENQPAGDFLDLSNSELLDAGIAICKHFANDKSEESVKRILINDLALPELNAAALIASAQRYLC